MREILFRGKRVDNGEWELGDLHTDSRYENAMILRRSVNNRWDGTFVQVDDSTVGQYTGLTDKNGKKIFEGDIVEAQFSSNHSTQAFVVVYQEGHFAFNNSCIAVPRWEIYNLRIIGNIYENGELLGGIR